jgi:hypothetical protein
MNATTLITLNNSNDAPPGVGTSYGPEPIPNLYQDRFLRLTENGELATDAIIKLTHRYLDGKPAKAGK